MNSGMKWAVSSLALFTFSIASAEVVRNPVNIGIALEEFQLFDANQFQGAVFDDPLITVRPTGWIFQSATIDDRIELVFGLGATTFSLPHDSGAFPTSNYQNELFPAVALVQASGSYTWGDLKNPMLKVTFGQMPYKYNPDAKNLGEYLFRSTPYPNTVLNSPFDLVGAAQAGILGGIVSKSFAGGTWKNDLLFTSANSSFPLYDFSLAYVTGYKINPIFEVGAGINLFRLIPVQPKVTTYKAGANAYFTYGGKEYSANSNLYKGNAMTQMDSLIAQKSDSVTTSIDDPNHATPLPTGVSGVDYYSLKGQMLMARFAIDFKPILGDKVDLKLYGEWAMLGVQNYPVFYDKPAERMPVMIGLNIPTGGLLDMLNVEAEYWKNPYLNSTLAMSYGGIGAPNLDITSYQQLGLTSIADPVEDDDLKWSISATKSLAKAISITAKASKDHLQVMQYMTASFPGKSYGDVMSGKKAWYYVLRVQVAI